MTTTPTYHLRPGIQFIYFWLIVIGAIFLGSIFGAAIIGALYGPDVLKDIGNMSLDSAQAHNALWIFQLCGTTLPLFLAPVIFAYFVVHDPDEYLKPHFEFKIVLLPIVLVIMFASNPILEFLTNLNQQLQLPPNLKWLQDAMRNSEDSTDKIVTAMMQMPTLGSMISILLFIGLLTAIVEEFMFRGCLQTIMFRWTKNIHVAVWVTAILFSAFHMEFFGFLPRVFLGAVLGYFVAWSGSVWTGVWAHFINNGTVVVIQYLYEHKYTKLNPDDQHVFSNVAFAIGTIITVLLLLLYRRIAKKSYTLQL